MQCRREDIKKSTGRNKGKKGEKKKESISKNLTVALSKNSVAFWVM